MQLHQLKPKTQRKAGKRVGRGGKRGTTSGHGTKGQKGRAGASVKPGFRGGDKRIWELFPKLRGATSKPGNARPHRKHRFFRLRHDKPAAINLDLLNAFSDGQVVNPQALAERGLIESVKQGVKILGSGALKRKLTFEGVVLSAAAKEKVAKAGGTISQ